MAPSEKSPLTGSSDGAVTGGGTFEPSEGLSTAEALKRLKEDGPNMLEAGATPSFFIIFVTQLKNIIFLLTVVAAALSWAMGDQVKTIVLLSIVSFVCLMNALGEWSGQDPGAALREQMGKEPVTVMRDGQEVQLAMRELVVGDVVKMKMGEIVPADILLTNVEDMQTNEAMLTGEPTEQVKTTTHEIKNPADQEAFPKNMAFSGTSVVCGRGTGEVVATGMRTQVGLIAKRLKDDTSPTETGALNPLQQSINFLGVAIGCICCVVIVLATSVSYYTGYQNPSAPCADDDDTCLLLSSISRGLLMAVSIIPHGLPFVVMVMLQVGSREMSLRNAMVTRRSAVDYLGATSVICTDKTGTLTQGKMTAKSLIGLVRQSNKAEKATNSQVDFYPLGGLSPNGGLFKAAALSQEAKKRMDAKWDVHQTRQVFAEPGLVDLAAQGATNDIDALLAQAHLTIGYLNCHATRLLRNEETGAWATLGNMTEAAVKVAAAKGGLWDQPGDGRKPLAMTYPRSTDLEVPFTSKRKMMATIHALSPDSMLSTIKFPSEATHCAILKGAPDRLMSRLNFVLALEDDGLVTKLVVPGGKISQEERASLQAHNDALANQALRSLMVVICPLGSTEIDALSKAASAEERLELLLEMPRLCFMSMWGIYDPPRTTVPGSILECHTAGIRVIMVTGDQRPTAMAIGKQVNIIQKDQDPIEASAWCKDMQVCSYAAPVSHRLLRKLSASSAAMLEEETGTASPQIFQETRTPGGRMITHDLSVYDKRQAGQDSHEPQYKSVKDLAEMTARVTVWARAQPTDKVALVESLIHQGHIVAMTGDGVNDAPALKRADAGVAMGISGTAVSKNAADLILMDDNFSTIVAAVKEGRRIYNNTQKYVTFNLSIKAGECICLMAAIVMGIPMPIRGLQLLLNLLVTHILPPLSLAFEPPEDYLMRVPPRTVKGDILVTRTMWLFRWLPFIICFPAVVLCCLVLGVWTATGFVNSNALIGSSRITRVAEGRVACEYAGFLDTVGEFIDDLEPFHCLCHAHLDGDFWSKKPRHIDQWGRVVSDEEIAEALNRWTGDTGDLFDVENTPWFAGTSTFVEPCADHRGVERWCWKGGYAGAADAPRLPQGSNCAAYGAQIGQTMSYMVIHLGEILTLCSFRTDGFFAFHLTTNPIYLGFLVFNLIMLAVFIYVPSVSGVLGLTPLTVPRVLTALVFALILVTLNECVKIVYRNRIAAENAVLGPIALERSLGVSAGAKGDKPAEDKV